MKGTAEVIGAGSLKIAATDDSAFIHEALDDYFPSRDLRDLSTSELSFIVRQAQRLKVAADRSVG